MVIAHFADIHCRLIQRQQEYKAVFDKVYKSLSNIKDKIGLDRISLAGDICHNKTTMSPEQINMVADFFIELEKIAPVDVFIGNHDLNLSNKDRLNALRPIVDLLKDKRVKLYTETGLYEVEPNLVYCNFSILDGKIPKIEKKDPKKTYVAVYHGPVNGCTLDNGTKHLVGGAAIETFDNYDIVMLGDIHKYQSFRNGTIVYPGSLIQQHFGESRDKGFIIWDTDAKTHKRILVPNDYGFVTINSKNNKLPTIEDLPKFSNIRVIFEINKNEISKTKILELKERIREKYSPQSISIIFKPLDESKEVVIDSKTNIRDKETQRQLLIKWLNNNKISTDLIPTIEQIETDIVQTLPIEDTIGGQTWEINEIQIENFLSYGTNTIISFKDMNGIIGLFGENAVGKSVIFEAILFALFAKTTRGVKNEDLINKTNEANSCKVQLTLRIEDDIYIITRTISKQKKGSKATLDYIKVLPSGEQENLSENQRTETEKIIRSTLGKFEDFLIAVLSTQNAQYQFISLGEAAQLDNIIRFLGIDIFSKKQDIAKEQLKEAAVLRKNVDIDQEKSAQKSLQLQIDAQVKEQDSIQKQYNDQQNQKEQLETLISVLNTSLHKDISLDYNESELLSNKQNTEANIVQLNKTLDEKKKSIPEIKTSITDLMFKVLSKDQIEELKKQKARLDDLQLQKRGNKAQLSSNLARITALKSELSQTSCPVADDSRTTGCKLFASIETRKKELQQLEDANKFIEKDINAQTKEIDSISIIDIMSQLEHQHEIALQIEKYNSEITKSTSDISAIESKIEVAIVSISIIEDKLKKINDTRTKIEQNKKIYEQLRVKQIDLKDLVYEMQTVNTKLIQYGKSIALLQDKLATLSTRIDALIQNEIKYQAYSIYYQAMSRDGITSSIIQDYIPIINFEINRILAGVVDFVVFFKLEEQKLEIVMRYNGNVDDTRPASMASGMERLLIDFSIRYALLTVSSLNRPSSWFIDEGFGVLDSDNMIAIQRYFQNIKQDFKNIVIITHLSEMKDVVDYSILVEKENGVSTLRNI